MATMRNLTCPFDSGKGSSVSIPLVANGPGAVLVCNFWGGTWCHGTNYW